MGKSERKNSEERERLSRAAQMPHRQNAGDSRLDARLESPLGRLFFEGEITEPQYQAGVRYREIGLRWLESCDAPEPYGGYLAALEDDLCLRRKLAYAQARTILRDVALCCARVLDRVAIYDEDPRGEWEIQIIRLGLRALSGEPVDKSNLAAA